MVGKKIGAALKQVWALKFVCEVNNVDFNSLTILPISYDPAPLMNHQIDAMLGFATNEPVQMEERGVKSHSMLLCDFGFKELTSTLTVRADALADPVQRKVIKAILAGTMRGWDDAVAEPEVTAKLVTARFGAQYALSESSQLTTLNAQIPFIATPEAKKNGLLTMSDADIAGTIETMTRVGVPIARDAFDTSLIDEIMAERAAGTKPS
jgi:ABC-type nitrate/sulfonate/bicarbonate transport system substrate-binding protein